MSTEVSIDPDVVLQGASQLESIRGWLPSGSLPPVPEVGDHEVVVTLEHLEGWWTTMSAGTSADVGAVAQTVRTVAAAQVATDREAATALHAGNDPMAPFRIG